MIQSEICWRGCRRKTTTAHTTVALRPRDAKGPQSPLLEAPLIEYLLYHGTRARYYHPRVTAWRPVAPRASLIAPSPAPRSVRTHRRSTEPCAAGSARRAPGRVWLAAPEDGAGGAGRSCRRLLDLGDAAPAPLVTDYLSDSDGDALRACCDAHRHVKTQSTSSTFVDVPDALTGENVARVASALCEVYDEPISRHQTRVSV